MTVKINIDNKTILRAVMVIVGFYLALSFISATKNVFTLLIISAFLAMALHSSVTYISSKITGGSRGLATGIAYLSVLSIIGLFLWASVPPLISQTRQFIHEFPTYVDDVANGDSAISRFIKDNNIDGEAKNFVKNYSSGTTFGQTSSKVFSGIGTIGSGLVSVLTVLVLTFFMLIEGPEWLNKFWEAQPKDKRAHREELGRRMYQIITGYVNGQLFIALIAATASLIMMLIVGLPLPLPLAGLVGLFGLIPLVGATLGSVVVILVALFQSVPSAIAMLIFFLLYQQIENTFIQPVIQSRALAISPLLIFIAVLFGINIGGLLGAFIAIPLAGILRIAILDIIDRHNLPFKNTTERKTKVKK